MNILKVHKGIFEIFMKKKVDEEGFQSPRRLGIKPYFSLFGISTSQ
jgi:hypothetical protein